MLRLADIDLDILGLRRLADDHAAVNLLARSDEERSSRLSLEETIGNRLAGLEGDERAVVTVVHITLVLAVAVKLGVQDTVTLGIGHELTTVADQTSRRNLELESGIAGRKRAHTVQDALPLGQLLDDVAAELIRNIDICDLHRLHLLAVLGLVDNLCL